MRRKPCQPPFDPDGVAPNSAHRMSAPMRRADKNILHPCTAFDCAAADGRYSASQRKRGERAPMADASHESHALSGRGVIREIVAGGIEFVASVPDITTSEGLLRPLAQRTT